MQGLIAVVNTKFYNPKLAEYQCDIYRVIVSNENADITRANQSFLIILSEKAQKNFCSNFINFVLIKKNEWKTFSLMILKKSSPYI